MKFLKQDITTINNGIIVHGVNAQGVMGAGVAKAIKHKWPTVYYDYHRLCNTNKRSSLLGHVQLIEVQKEPEIIVANLFSQEFFGNDGKTYANPFAIVIGLTRLFMFARDANMDIHSVKIGGLRGGLNWDTDVKPGIILLEQRFPDVNIYVYDL